MYHADTPTRTIDAYDFDGATGTPSNRRAFAHFTDETHRPDGAAVDSDGCYWTAFYGGGKVARLAPVGHRAGRVSDSGDVPDDVRVRRPRSEDAVRDERAPAPPR